MSVTFHIQRAFMCQVPLAEPIEEESKILQEQRVTNKIVQSYFIWRRSCLLTALPALFLGMILGLLDLRGTFKDTALNGLGKLLVLMTSFDTAFLFAAVLYAVMKWNYFPKSVLYVRIGFFIAFVMPLLPALFPLEMIIQGQYISQMDDATIVAMKLSMAMSYILQLLPVIVTFPGGALRGALRIRWLLPESTLSGWIILMCAPFYSIVVCIALVVVMQVVGNVILFIGTVLIVTIPWTYVVLADLFVSVWDDKKKEKVQQVQRVMLFTSLSGYILILIWAFTCEVAGVKVIGENTETTTALLSYTSAIRIVIELIGRLLVTTIMFSDVILRMSLRNWTESVQEGLSTHAEIESKVDAFINVFGNPVKDENAITTAEIESDDRTNKASESADMKDDTVVEVYESPQIVQAEIVEADQTPKIDV